MLTRKEKIEEIMRNFMSIKRMLMENHQPQKDLPVTPTQLQVLFVVKHCEGIGAKEIADKLGVSSSAATQLIDILVDNGYLTRENDTKDRRAINISLSQKARKTFCKFKDRALLKITSVLDILTDNELDQYQTLSEKIAGNMQR